MSAATLDLAPLWEIAKGVMLFSCTALLSWIAKTLQKVLRTLIDHGHILVGVDGKNGLKSDVRLLNRRVGAIEDRNIAIDAVTEAERHLHAEPDRRVGPRRMRDVVHEAIDERTRRITDEHSIEG